VPKSICVMMLALLVLVPVALGSESVVVVGRLQEGGATWLDDVVSALPILAIVALGVLRLFLPGVISRMFGK